MGSNTVHPPFAPDRRSPHILLRSSWQTVNIGDIGHTPGILSLLRRHLPEVAVTLWPNQLDRGVREMLVSDFPDLHILDVPCGPSVAEDHPGLAEAFESADFLLHSSGPHLVGVRQLELWHRLTGKPYGVYGVTLDPLAHAPGDPDCPTEGSPLAEQRRQIAALPTTHLDPLHRHVLDEASFVFCRDTLTLEHLHHQGVRCPVLDFAPDAAFGIELRDDARADAFLAAHGLEPGNFICAIPRLRYTPYHLTHNLPAVRRDLLRMEISDRHRERDMEKFREAIIRWVRTTGVKVLLCPEMTYQIELAKTHVFDRLPADVKDKVVCRSSYWLPGEACSTYARARLLLSMDNHSPIFALAQGVPVVFLRHPTDTIKGHMWLDLQMGDWFVETDATDGADIAARILRIHADYPAALVRVNAFMARVRSLQASTLAKLAGVLPGHAMRQHLANIIS
jgi:hypothetical protein